MKRLSIIAIILCSLVSAAWAQIPGGKKHFGKVGLPRQHQSNVVNKSTGIAKSAASLVQPVVATNMKVWQLGTYPGGNWSWLNDVNDLGALVGWSNLSGPDLQRPVMVPLFGPNAKQWFDLGTLGEGVEAFGISDTGIVVGHAFNAEGYERAFAWTAKTGMADLETFPGELVSGAFDINRIGTMIVGWSTTTPDAWSLPAYWTPKLEWTANGFVTTWKIHRLQASAVSSYPYGLATAVNNFGQILGAVWNDNEDSTGIVWSPAGRGKWTPKPFYGNADYIDAWPAEINDRGEVVGSIYESSWTFGCGALWQPRGPQKAYKLVLLANPWGLCNGDGGIGINNRGDIVGAVVQEDWNSRAAHWTTRNPHYVELMPLMDLDWSYSANVNEFGIAAATYGGGDFMQSAAVLLH